MAKCRITLEIEDNEYDPDIEGEYDGKATLQAIEESLDGFDFDILNSKVEVIPD